MECRRIWAASCEIYELSLDEMESFACAVDLPWMEHCSVTAGETPFLDLLVSYRPLARVFSSGRPAFLEPLRCSAELATVAFVVSCSQLRGCKKRERGRQCRAYTAGSTRASPLRRHTSQTSSTKNI